MENQITIGQDVDTEDYGTGYVDKLENKKALVIFDSMYVPTMWMSVNDLITQ